MSTVRLIDPDGYTVPGGVRDNVPASDINTVSQDVLTNVAPQHAAQWADFGYDARLYSVQVD